MPRVPVPEAEYGEYDRVTVAGYNDHLYGQADVNLDDVAHGPLGLRVDRDDDGLYVGCSPAWADDVAAFLGTTVQAESESEPDATDDTADGSDDTDDADEPAGTCQHVLTSGDREGETCGRDLPCPYHDDDT